MTSLYGMKMPHLKTLYEYMVATATEMVHVPELPGIFSIPECSSYPL